MTASATPSRAHQAGSTMEVLVALLKLGLTSFGGPVAHIGYFRREFVECRHWLGDATFTNLVELYQFLPGPASSQIGFSVDLLRVGWHGGLAAQCGFMLPSVLLLLIFAVLVPSLGGLFGAGLIHGLRLVAVAVIAQAVWGMARKLCPDWQHTGVAVLSIVVLGALATAYAQLVVIALGTMLGLVLCRASLPANGNQRAGQETIFSVSHVASIVSLTLFCTLLFGLPALTDLHPWMPAKVFDAFHRLGTLVFGGGYVVLPLPEQQTVTTGWAAPNDFLIGYGAAQTVPGPFFTLATFLGWTIGPGLSHRVGAALATVGIFLPG